MSDFNKPVTQIPPRKQAMSSIQDTFLPLSFAQQHIWLGEQIASGNLVQYYPVYYRLTGELNLFALQRALNEIVRRHEALRTRFLVRNWQSAQVIDEVAEVQLDIVDWSNLSLTDRTVKIQTFVEQDAQIPFDLEKGSLLRAAIIRENSDRHCLMLTFHRMVFDSWSAGVFCQELTLLYAAFAAGQLALLPDISYQYADFARRQHQPDAQARLQRELAYWQQHLSGTLPVLDLPSDRTRPAAQTCRGAICELAISAELTQRLKALSDRYEATLFMTLLTAFKILLARHSGQRDIVVGVPVDGRDRPELKRLIGAFSNYVALRTDLSEDLSFKAFLQQVKQVSLQGFAHQNVPFGKVIEAVQPGRDLSRSPIFQAQFKLDELTAHCSPQESDISITELPLAPIVAACDLALEITETASGLTCVFRYPTDLFDCDTIQRLSEHFHCLLTEIPEQVNCSIFKIPMLRVSEQRQLLSDWNQTQQAYPLRCVHQLFEQQAIRLPDAIAARYSDLQVNEALTYRQLNEQANQLAHYLRELGVKPGVKVGICVKRSLSMIVAHLGVLKAGGAYVPIDMAYPPERIAYMVEDAQPVLMLVEASNRHQFADRTTVCLACDQDKISQRPTDFMESGVALDDLAYVIYTSGSTGKPKGVAIKHRGVTNFLHSLVQKPGLNENDRLLAIATICFDMTTLELYLPLIVGAQVVITSREIAMDGSQLRQTIAAQGITAMQGTPATWQLLLAAKWQPTPGMKVFCGGEAMSPALADAILAGGGQLWNMYGPTETTVYSSLWPITHSSEATCIGKPLANTQFYILDEALQPVPIGVAGELYIGGEGLAQGYWNRPELTAERFIPWPFSESQAISTALDSRLYKTGDLARYNPDGTVVCLGRLDRQVKIRGFRIELGELEALLRQHPAIQQSLIIAQSDTSGHRQLVGYVVPVRLESNDHEVVSERMLKQYLKQQIPAYMVPAAIVILDKFPLTPNGKVDARSLPQPHTIETASAFMAPRDAIETELQEFWQAILARAPIGVQDDFFEVGGHSLLAVQLLAKIEKFYGRSLPLTSFLQSPTIEGQANLLRDDPKVSRLGEPSHHRLDSLIPISLPGRNESKQNSNRTSLARSQPLFCVHGAGGSVLMYRDFAKHIDERFYVYGLQSSYFNNPDHLLKTVEEMADLYLEELRTVQPHGPYLIAGYCGGCPIALEIAQRLRANNQTVSLLVLFDPAPIRTNKAPYLPEYDRTLSTRLQSLFLRIQHEGLKAVIDNYLLKTVVWYYERRQIPLPLRLRIVKVQAVNMQALREYIAQEPYAAPMAMYLPEQGMTPQGKIPEGWQTLADGEFSTHSVPGKHHHDGASVGSFFSEPAVRTLSGLLSNHLAIALRN